MSGAFSGIELRRGRELFVWCLALYASVLVAATLRGEARRMLVSTLLLIPTAVAARRRPPTLAPSVTAGIALLVFALGLAALLWPLHGAP